MKAAIWSLAPLLAAVPLVLAQAQAPAAGTTKLDNPAYRAPDESWRTVEEAVARAECGAKIRQVRGQNGQPALDRETADPDNPLFVAAVDHRIEGCSVLVMKQDTSDVRPEPETTDGPAALIPAR